VGWQLRRVEQRPDAPQRHGRVEQSLEPALPDPI